MTTLTLHPAVRGPVRPTAPLRLTARGRLVVRATAGLCGVGLALAAVLAGGRVANASSDARPLAVEYHVVRPGETLWQIAGASAPGADRRDTVARIVELNALRTAELQAGQRIAVPARP
jgi:Tfp pilus assembly protein FimV